MTFDRAPFPTQYGGGATLSVQYGNPYNNHAGTALGGGAIPTATPEDGSGLYNEHHPVQYGQNRIRRDHTGSYGNVASPVRYDDTHYTHGGGALGEHTAFTVRYDDTYNKHEGDALGTQPAFPVRYHDTREKHGSAALDDNVDPYNDETPQVNFMR